MTRLSELFMARSFGRRFSSGQILSRKKLFSFSSLDPLLLCRLCFIIDNYIVLYREVNTCLLKGRMVMGGAVCMSE